jgi:hypothetical protein
MSGRIDSEEKKKKLPYLKCGEIIFTYIWRRICQDCKAKNKDIRGVKARVLTGQRSAKQTKLKED